MGDAGSDGGHCNEGAGNGGRGGPVIEVIFLCVMKIIMINERKVWWRHGHIDDIWNYETDDFLLYSRRPSVSGSARYNP